MKAYIKISDVKKKEFIDFIHFDIERLGGTFFIEGKLEELCFDLDKVYIKGEKIILDGGYIEIDRNAKYIYEEKQKMIYSNIPFEYVINNMREFDDKISKLLENKYVKNVIQDKSVNLENLYKTILWIIATIQGDIGLKMILIIGGYTYNYGFIKNEYNGQYLENKCNVLNAIYTFYIIYETFYLFRKLNDVTSNISVSIFKSIFTNASEEDIINKINYNLKCLENISIVSYISKFNDKNFTWENELLFNNSLSLVIYELRTQLSKNTDYRYIICKNPLCLKTIGVTNGHQLYCSDNKECLRTRANQRKAKSRNHQKSKN